MIQFRVTLGIIEAREIGKADNINIVRIGRTTLPISLRQKPPLLTVSMTHRFSTTSYQAWITTLIGMTCLMSVEPDSLG